MTRSNSFDSAYKNGNAHACPSAVLLAKVFLTVIIY